MVDNIFLKALLLIPITIFVSAFGKFVMDTVDDKDKTLFDKFLVLYLSTLVWTLAI